MPETLQQLSYPKEEWEIAKKYIAPAIKHQDLYLLEDVEAKIYDGTFQLWRKTICFYNRGQLLSAKNNNQLIILRRQI